MTIEESRALRINEPVIWSAVDDRGCRHDLKGRVLAMIPSSFQCNVDCRDSLVLTIGTCPVPTPERSVR
jgi:hypothetical protein